MSETMLIRVQGLTLTYGERTVLDDLGFSLAPGQRLGIIGPNGSGKTTLLHCLMGLVPPDKGVVRLFGSDMRTEKDFAAARRRIGFLFQNPDDQLFCPTVIDDVAFGPLNLGKKPGRALEVARKTLQRLGLEGYGNRVTYRLSGGEKKLVALATILAMEPEVLLLDEPTNDLDEATRHRLVHILQDLRLPSVLVSHDYDFLRETADSLAAMQDGALLPSPMSALHEHVHAHPLGTVPHSHGADRATVKKRQA